MQLTDTITDLPTKPAVYAMHGGTGHYRYVAYVGIADDLRRRIGHHLIRRDSSVTTGVAAASLNPDLVTEVEWWQHPAFGKNVALAAAEIVAFDVLNPALRSRGTVAKLATQYLLDNPAFSEELRDLFTRPPTGRLVRPSLQSALERIAALERRLTELEQDTSTAPPPTEKPPT